MMALTLSLFARQCVELTSRTDRDMDGGRRGKGNQRVLAITWLLGLFPSSPTCLSFLALVFFILFLSKLFRRRLVRCSFCENSSHPREVEASAIAATGGNQSVSDDL